MGDPIFALIVPLGGNIPGLHPGGGPVYPGHPANRPPGSGGGPVDPGWGGGWGGGAVDPGWGQGGGEHPGNRPPGTEHPGGGPSGGGQHPSGQPIVPPQGGTPVPEDEYTPAPPPEDITSQYIVSVWDPRTMTWTTKTYPPR